MLIRRDTNDPSFHENLVVQIDSLNNTVAFIAEYDSSTESDTIHDSYELDRLINVIPIEYNSDESLISKMVYGCLDIYEIRCSGGSGTGICDGRRHIPQEECYERFSNCIGYSQTGMTCGYYDDGTSTSGGGTNTPSPPNGPGHSGPSGNGIFTSNVKPQPWQDVALCINGDLAQSGSNAPVDNTTLTSDMLTWLQSDKRKSGLVANYLANNNCSDESQAFSIAAITALMDNDGDGQPDGEVDWDDKRINGIKFDSSLPVCLESMILDLMLGNFPYSDSMGNIELIEDTFNTLGIGNPLGIDFVATYKVANISGNGATSPISYDSTTNIYSLEITIDTDLVANGTKLSIIKTVLHESIHAYLKYLAKQFPAYFNDPNGSFSNLITAYQTYNNSNDAHHIYMAGIITNMANNVSNFVQEKYGYPVSTSDYYEAVCWSGITHLRNGNLNPLFSSNYPSFNDQQNIIKIFNTENGTASFPGYLPLINNNCN